MLRLRFEINEAVTTLLLNYVAVDVMLFLIYDAWKDPHGSGQPATAPVPTNEQLPLIGNSTVHLGFVLAIVATGVVWFALTRTSWGFQLSVVGGNPEAARRAGLKVGLLLLSAMLVGGALAGLGGFAQLAGVEYKLRPGFLLTYGYIGFLASWLARHQPVRVALGGHVARRDRGRRRQLAARLRPPGGVGEHPHGPRAARRLRVGRQAEGGHLMNLGLELMTRRRARWHVDPLRRSRRDGVGARRRGEPRHRGQHAVRCARAPTRRTRRRATPGSARSAGAAAGGALALVHAYFVLGRKTNQLATGLVVLFLALGITSLFGAAYVDEIITPFKIWDVPLLSSIPWIGDIFFKARPAHLPLVRDGAR